ncbi:MAG TPA: MATE family efflux transporter [Desulfuromonadaceae bacterium]
MDLTTSPIGFLIRRLAIPAGTGFFFNTMFNVVDTWYGGRLSTTALAAMSLSFPVFFIILSIGTGVSSSATALIGNALGRDAPEEAAVYIRQAFSFAFIHAIALTILGLIMVPHIFRSMGASGEYLALALSYMNVIFAGSFFFMFNFVMSAILNSHGDTATYRNFLITGFFLNVILDPWFMYGGLGLPALGLPGIALATVVIQCLGNAFIFRRLSKSGIVGTIHLKELIPRWQYYRELFKLGYPSTMNMMTVTLGIFIITWFVSRYGKEAVAAYGIGTRIEQIALLPVMGLNISTLALTAQNYGAGHINRIREVLRISLRYGFLLSSLGTIAALLFADKLMAFFTSDPLVIAAGIKFLHVEAFVIPAYVMLYICSSAMQGIKRPMFTLGIGIYRQIAAPFLVFHLLMTVFGWGIMGIWWGIFMITWSAAALFVTYISWILKKLEKDMQSV